MVPDDVAVKEYRLRFSVSETEYGMVSALAFDRDNNPRKKYVETAIKRREFFMIYPLKNLIIILII
jgi:hypothetical protein